MEKSMKYIIYTLGCKVNQYETQAIETLLNEHGHTAASEGESADAVIVNTCAVTAESGRKSRQTIRRLRDENPGAVVAYLGDLGMGKTAFTRGLAAGLGYKGRVTSPTFAIVNEYEGGRLPLFHFDMYRINTYDDLYSTGFFDYLDTGILVIEWSENIENALPDDYISVEIKKGENDDDRIIKIEGIEL